MTMTAITLHVPSAVRWRGATARTAVVTAIAGTAAILGVAFVDGFGSVDNFLSLLRLGSALCIVAVGASIVIMSRGIDLSAAAIVAVIAQSAAALLGRGHPEWRVLLVVTAMALGMGVLNGVLVAYFEIPALFATLATWQLFTGVFTLTLLDSTFYALPASSNVIHRLGRGELVGIPAPIWVAAVVLAAAAAFWNLTSLGRMARALGDSPPAAFIAGFPVRPLRVLTFVLGALCAGLAALVILGNEGGYSTSYGAGTDLLFDALAVAVIGGVSLSGGKGSVSGLVASAVLIAIVVNLMVLLDLSIVQRNLVKALVLLSAITFDAVLNPHDEEAARAETL